MIPLLITLATIAACAFTIRLVLCLIFEDPLIPCAMRVDYERIKELERALGIGREIMIARVIDARGDHEVRRLRPTPYPLFFVNDNCRAARRAREVFYP